MQAKGPGPMPANSTMRVPFNGPESLGVLVTGVSHVLVIAENCYRAVGQGQAPFSRGDACGHARGSAQKHGVVIAKLVARQERLRCERCTTARMPAMPLFSSHLHPSDFRFQLLKTIRGKHERINCVGATVAG